MNQPRRWWRRRVWRWQTAIAAGVLLMGLSSSLNATLNIFDEHNEHANDQIHRELIDELLEEVDQLQEELACRASSATEASNIQGQIGQATALGLVAVARGDDAALATQADRIEDLARQLGPALDRRADAVTDCAPDERPPP